MNILKQLSRISGFIILFVGVIIACFTVWQLDMLFTAKIWGPAATNIQFYSDLIGNGYNSMGGWPWTINVWLFPTWTAGVSYDMLMIINLAMLPVVAIGTYLVTTRFKREGKKHVNAVVPTS